MSSAALLSDVVRGGGTEGLAAVEQAAPADADGPGRAGLGAGALGHPAARDEAAVLGAAGLTQVARDVGGDAGAAGDAVCRKRAAARAGRRVGRGRRLAAALCAAALLPPAPCGGRGRALAGEDGGPPARSEVPAPRGRVNHGPGLAYLPSGELLLCWYSAPAEADAGARILCSRSADRGAGWSDPRVAVGPGDAAVGAREANKSLGNVVLFADPGHQRLWMVHGVIQRWRVPVLGDLCRTWRCGRVDVRVSADAGRGWSAAARLDDGVGALPRAGLLRHPGLGALLPLYREGEETSHVRQVEFGPAGLRLGPPLVVPARGVIQPSLVLQRDGRVRAFLRDTAAVAVRTAVLDPRSGRWGEAVATSLPNPGSAVDAFADDDGRFVVVHNPSRRDRRALRLASSRDGIRFTPGCDLVAEGREGEVAYPTAVRAPDGAWHVAYSAHAKARIHHVRFGADWLRGCLG
jgi:BNR repeat protein